MSRGEPIGRRTWIACAVLFAAALGVRIVYLVQLGATPFVDELGLMADSRYYDMRAREIATGGWIGDAPGFLSPLYCFTLGLVYRVVGFSLMGAKLFQAVLGALSCVLLYLIGRRVFFEAVGWIAGAGLAVYSTHVYYTGLLLPTILIVFLHLVLVWVLAGGLDPRRAAAGGVLVGLSILAKSNAVLLLPALLLGLWLAHRREGLGRRLAASALLVAGAGLAVAPVTVANYLVSDRFVLVTTTGGSNLLKGNGPDADGTHVFLPRWAEATGMAAHLTHTVDAGRALRESRELTRQTVRHMAAHPLRTAKLLGKKLLLFLNARELGIRDQYYFARSQIPLLRGPLIPFWAVVPLGLVGAVLAWPLRGRLHVLYAVLAVQLVSFVLVFVLARYRLVFVACLMPFAACELLQLVESIRHLAWTKLRAPVLLLAVFGAVMWIPFGEFPRDRGFADQYKFVADHHFDAAEFETAAEAYEAALGASWQDPLRSDAPRWECMLRLGLARIQVGRWEEARETLERLLRELEDSSAGIETGIDRRIRDLLRQIGP